MKGATAFHIRSATTTCLLRRYDKRAPSPPRSAV